METAICSKVDGLRDYHTNWNELDRGGQISYFSYVEYNLKGDTN